MDQKMTDITDAEMACLKRWITFVVPTNYLELGCFHCETIIEIAKTFPYLKCTGVDVFDIVPLPQPNTHRDTIAKFSEMEKKTEKISNIVLFAHTTTDYLTATFMFNFRFGFVFHDANHTYDAVSDDLLLIHSVLEPDGIAAVHNTSTNIIPDDQFVKRDGGPRKAIEFILKTGKYEKMEEIQRLTILRKI